MPRPYPYSSELYITLTQSYGHPAHIRHCQDKHKSIAVVLPCVPPRGSRCRLIGCSTCLTVDPGRGHVSFSPPGCLCLDSQAGHSSWSTYSRLKSRRATFASCITVGLDLLLLLGRVDHATAAADPAAVVFVCFVGALHLHYVGREHRLEEVVASTQRKDEATQEENVTRQEIRVGPHRQGARLAFFFSCNHEPWHPRRRTASQPTQEEGVSEVHSWPLLSMGSR